MGTVVLVLGVALWWAAHLFKRVMPQTAGRDGRNRSLGRNRRDHLVGRAYGDRL